jgi:hypothetical protein
MSPRSTVGTPDNNTYMLPYGIAIGATRWVQRGFQDPWVQIKLSCFFFFFFQINIIYNNIVEIPFNFIFSDFSTPNIWVLVAPLSIVL